MLMPLCVGIVLVLVLVLEATVLETSLQVRPEKQTRRRRIAHSNIVISQRHVRRAAGSPVIMLLQIYCRLCQ